MMDWLLAHLEVVIRLGSFLGIFGSMAMGEVLAARRPLTVSKAARWRANLSLTFVNAVLVRLLFAAGTAGAAIFAAEHGYGLFNRATLPFPLEFIVSILVLDLIVYGQHYLFHRIPLLWRLHAMHHADLDLDLTTGARFHPLEIILSMAIKASAVIALGAPAAAAVAFEVILNGAAMFNHANLRLPLGLDRVLRLFIVTPDFHRVHHSVIYAELNSNFGFNLSVWDRLFGTYTAQPRKGHLDMTIGLARHRDPAGIGLLRLLGFPMGPVQPNRFPRRRDHTPQ